MEKDDEEMAGAEATLEYLFTDPKTNQVITSGMKVAWVDTKGKRHEGICEPLTGWQKNMEGFGMRENGVRFQIKKFTTQGVEILDENSNTN